MSSTIDYYNQNAKSYSSDTVNVDFSLTQERFLKCLSPCARVLDFGCGSGRDTKYFLEKGFKVDAIDGSEELCKLARDLTGNDVRQMFFEDFSAPNTYNGIWACSSILHLQWEPLVSVMKNLAAALKPNGVLYASFKYGDFSGERNGRFFTDIDEDRLKELLAHVPDLQIRECWISADVRPNRSNEKWMNIILSRKV